MDYEFYNNILFKLHFRLKKFLTKGVKSSPRFLSMLEIIIDSRYMISHEVYSVGGEKILRFSFGMTVSKKF